MSRRISALLVTLIFTWSGLAALYSQTPAPRIGCRVADRQIATSGSTRFEIFADQLPPLTAFTITLTYQSNTIQFFDDPNLPLEGINLTPGDVFPANSFSQNLVDTVNGQIRIAVSPPVSSTIKGDFDILAFGYLSGNNRAVAHFQFTDPILYDHNAALLNRAFYAVEGCYVQVGDSGTPVPSSTPTYYLSPLLTSTSTPPGFISIDPTPTSTPTQTPTFTPTVNSPLATPTDTNTPFFTPTPEATFTPVDTDTPIPSETPTEVPTETSIVVTTPDNQASADQSPLETPTETPFPIDTPTDTPAPTETPSETPTETPLPAPTPTATETFTPEPPTATATPIRQPTPTVMAQVDRKISGVVEVINQPAAQGNFERQQPYLLLAVTALFGGLVLLLAFWQ
ncbi:MAG TPA: hypothetical protein PL105_23240, partial [Caldilineaceae bacterium]|nr:hypothetical protein [Caldilineaceae bacterium]